MRASDPQEQSVVKVALRVSREGCGADFTG